MYGCAVPQPPFQNPHCGGQIINNQTVTLGCIPLTPPLMQDFQDFVNFLAGDTKRPRSFAVATKKEASQSLSFTRCDFLIPASSQDVGQCSSQDMGHVFCRALQQRAGIFQPLHHLE